MPMYEYKCEKCHYSFETMQKMSEAPLRQCPKCQSSIRKVIGIGGVVTKGSSSCGLSCENSSSGCGYQGMCSSTGCGSH